MSETPREIVHVDRVSKDVRPGLGLRKKRILHDVSLDVQEGEIFGFVGPNGAGKTTLLKLLMGLVRPTSGSARILGHDVSENAYRSQVGFLPEAPYFYHYLTGREILSFYARLSGVAPGEVSPRVNRLLDWVQLAHAADARLRTYSKGMLQRVGIAQALVHDPRVVFLDEPMSGLDPIGRKEIRDLILHLREEGKTVFMNTHILPDVEMLCDRIAVIVEGRIRYTGRTHEAPVGSQRETDLVLAGLAPELAQRLESRAGAPMRGHGDHVELRVGDKDVEEILGEAIAAGARIVSVNAVRPSLETLFLSAVKGEMPTEQISVPAGEESQ